MSSFCRIVDSHRLYHVGLPAVVTINGNVIFVNPLSIQLFGRIASVQSDRPHERAITFKLLQLYMQLENNTISNDKMYICKIFSPTELWHRSFVFFMKLMCGIFKE